MEEFLTQQHSVDRCRFGMFEFDQRTLELTTNGRVVRVRPQALKLLVLLLARPGELISRQDLQRGLWSDDTFVDFEQGVNHAIKELRTALGDDAESPRFIQTLPRRGYRFIAPVSTRDSSRQHFHEASERTPFEKPSESTNPRTRRPQLRRAWASGLGVVALAGAIAAWYFSNRPSDATSLTAATALVIRPFAVPADPPLGVGLADAISARLGSQQRLSVRSDLSRAGTDRTPGRGDVLAWPRDVTHALEGEITLSGTLVDVRVRLQDAAGTTVWSERFHLRADELFSLEDVIAERVVRAMQLRLAATEQDRLRRRYTSNNAAYREYLRGRAALVRYTPEGTQAAIRAFEGALQIDPAYSLARAGLAMACADMYLRFAQPDDVEKWGERAEREARAALQLDGNLAEAHLARAAVARKREFDWGATVAAGRRALALNPNLDQARFFVAAAYYHNGYMEEAIIEMEKGRSVHGLDVIEPIRIYALVALFSGHFAPALVHLQEVSRLSSQPIGDTYLALAYHYSGSTDRARAMLESLTDSRSASTAARAGAALASIVADRGEFDAARLGIGRVVTGAYRDHHVAYSLGAAYAQLGETIAAHRWLKIAADTGFPCLTFFERDPLLEPLRSRRDFQELLAYVRARRNTSLAPGTAN